VGRTLVDLATVERLEVAVAAADATLQTKACRLDDIVAALDSVQGHPYSRRARIAILQVDGRAESPGETRTRLVLNSSGMRLDGALVPRSELQISVFDERGRFVGRADGGYPELGVLWEYDGKGKYGALLKPGQSPLDALLAEKRREEQLTELGFRVLSDGVHFSDVVTAAWLPDGVDGKALVTRLRQEHGIIISGGQQSLAGKIIRIGHVGWVQRAELDAVFAALQVTLPKVGGRVAVAVG